MDKHDILTLAAEQAGKTGNADLVRFAAQTIVFLDSLDVKERIPTKCACGDDRSISGMCDDCFNVGCKPHIPCFWGFGTHEEESA